MLAAVRSHRKQTDNCAAPMLVHCSAGVGRTGCFILIDQAFRLLEGRRQVGTSNLFKPVQTCSNLFKPVQTCPNSVHQPSLLRWTLSE
jgi:protein tyrosine phosphatase